jgi:hypothetical protein
VEVRSPSAGGRERQPLLGAHGALDPAPGGQLRLPLAGPACRESGTTA